MKYLSQYASVARWAVVFALAFGGPLGCASQEEAPEGAAAEATTPEGTEEFVAPEGSGSPAGSTPEGAEAVEGAAAAAEQPVAGSYGAGVTDRDLVALAQISANPNDFAGQTVKTEGEITQVCQRMGCWMEMQAEGTSAVRVPMAGHGFFLPRHASGHQVTIEGEVMLRELSDAEREHLASEGAQVVASALQINATGVVIH